MVAPGSTVLELFGPPIAPQRQEKLDTEIDDGPTDLALARLFELRDAVNVRSLADVTELEMAISIRLGGRLFALADSLIQSDVDINMIWTRPRGAHRTADFTRSTARGFRALLDVETVESISRTERRSQSSWMVPGWIPSFCGAVWATDVSWWGPRGARIRMAPRRMLATRLHPRSAQDSGRVAPSARTEPVCRLAPAAASGVATSSSDLPSASTARNQATSPPTIITPAPSK
jgi:hypothetical protein